MNQRGVVAPDQHAGMQLLPDPGHGEEQRRLDLVEVRRDRVDRLGEVEHRAAAHHVPCGEDPLRDVAQRQIGDDQVGRVGHLAVGEARRLVDDGLHRERRVGVGQHRPLRRPGGAGRVDEGHHVIGPGGIHASFDLAGVARPVLAAEIEERRPRHQPRVVVGVQPTRLEVDDRARTRGGPHRQHLVDLFLILGEVDDGTGIGHQVGHLGGRVGRVQANGDAAHRDGRQVEQHPLGAVLGLDGDPVADVDSEGQQAVGGVEHEVPDLVPGVLAPDAEVLVAHRHVVRRALRPVPGQRSDGGHCGGRDLGRPLTRHRNRHGAAPPFTWRAMRSRSRR